MEKINIVLKQIEEAYRIELFPDPTDSEKRDVYYFNPFFFNRVSASTARYLVNLIRLMLQEKYEIEIPQKRLEVLELV